MNYTLDDLMVLGKRYGNPKRSYLLIDPLQAKHLAVSPSKALAMMDALGEKLAAAHPDTGCIIGFAETATAIAARSAMHFPPHTVYVQTTREPRKKGMFILDFSEEHSHAVEQLLDTSLIAKQLKFNLLNERSVMLIDDEISTGKTARNIIHAICEKMPLLTHYGSGFVLGSVINRMTDSAKAEFAGEGIACASLIDSDIDGLEERVSGFEVQPPAELPDVPAREFDDTVMSDENKIPDTRKGGVFVHDLKMWLDKFVGAAFAAVNEKHDISDGTRVLVLGTEECMLPALLLGAEIETKTGAEVYSHSTTRSPIGISTAEGYPVYKGYHIASFYEDGRDTYIYDSAEYDLVIAVTDSKNEEQAKKAMNDITKAFAGSKEFVLIR